MEHTHNGAGVDLVLDQCAVDRVITAVLVVLLGQGFDDANALGIFPNYADHIVHRALYPGEQGDALAGDKEDEDKDDGHQGQHDHGQMSVHEQGDAHPANQQNGGAHAHALQHSHKLVDVISVCGNA